MKLGIFEWLLWSDSCLVKQLMLIFLSRRPNFCIFFPDKHVSLITIVTGFEEEWCVLCHSFTWVSQHHEWERECVISDHPSSPVKWKTNILTFHPVENVLWDSQLPLSILCLPNPELDYGKHLACPDSGFLFILAVLNSVVLTQFFRKQALKKKRKLDTRSQRPISSQGNFGNVKQQRHWWGLRSCEYRTLKV